MPDRNDKAAAIFASPSFRLVPRTAYAGPVHGRHSHGRGQAG